MVQVWNRNRSLSKVLNRNFSKVGTRTGIGTVKNSYGYTTVLWAPVGDVGDEGGQPAPRTFLLLISTLLYSVPEPPLFPHRCSSAKSNECPEPRIELGTPLL
jgi:hypothetical protein